MPGIASGDSYNFKISAREFSRSFSQNRRSALLQWSNGVPNPVSVVVSSDGMSRGMNTVRGRFYPPGYIRCKQQQQPSNHDGGEAPSCSPAAEASLAPPWNTSTTVTINHSNSKKPRDSTPRNHREQRNRPSAQQPTNKQNRR